MDEYSREIEVGYYLPNEVQEALAMSLHPIDRSQAAAVVGCHSTLINLLIQGNRKVTESNKPAVLYMLKKAKERSSDMAANGHRIFNLMNEFDLSLADDQVFKMAQDGKY